jgi:hypothetical protein
MGDISSFPSGYPFITASSVLAYAENITTGLSNLGAITDVPGLSVSFFSQPGRKIKITALALGRGDINTTMQFEITDGSNNRVQAGKFFNGVAKITDQQTMQTEYVFTAASPGTYTFKARFGYGSGTGTVDLLVGATFPAFILAEDITGGVPGLDNAAWISWTPTVTNLSGGTIATSKYTKIGRTVHYKFRYTLAGAGVGTNPQFTLPVVPSSDYTGQDPPIGSAFLIDNGTASYPGPVVFSSGSTADIRCLNGAGTYVLMNTITSTIPFTWAVNDALWAYGTYEAAM